MLNQLFAQGTPLKHPAEMVGGLSSKTDIENVFVSGTVEKSCTSALLPPVLHGTLHGIERCLGSFIQALGAQFMSKAAGSGSFSGQNLMQLSPYELLFFFFLFVLFLSKYDLVLAFDKQ